MAFKLRNIFSKKQLDPAQLGGSNIMLGAGSAGWAGQQDKIFRMFDSCGLDYDNLHPKTQMRLSRMMYNIFPFVKRAMNDIASMVGNIEVGGDLSESQLETVRSLVNCLPILSEHDWINPHEKGFNNLVFRMARTTLKDGMCFVESRVGDGRDYLGELIYDSANFDFERHDLNPYRLVYQANQFPDISNDEFKSIGYDFTNAHPWASPLVSGGGFFTHILIAILIAIKNTNMRKGAPVELGIVTVKDSDSLKGDVNKQKSFKEAVNQMSAQLEEATRAQLNGTPYTIVSKMPINVELLTKAFGAESIKEIDHQILSIVLVQIMNLLEVPPDFFGIVIGNAGFSGDRFRILYKIWSGKVDNLREKIKPILSQILVDYLLSSGVDARIVQRININFINTQILDDKEIEEVEKIKAEKEKIQIENAGNLAQTDTTNARNYLLDRGLL